MRAVVQRVASARVEVGGGVAGEIGKGILLFVAVAPEDTDAQAEWLADKVANLRIFNDEIGKMNLSLNDVGGEALVVSQFTLYGDARRGRRPSFVRAARGPKAEAMYRGVIGALESSGVRCASGEFGAMMSVTLTNDGPVTILLDSAKSL